MNSKIKCYFRKSIFKYTIGFVLLKLLDLFVPDHEDTDENHDTENAAHIGLISALAVILEPKVFYDL